MTEGPDKSIDEAAVPEDAAPSEASPSAAEASLDETLDYVPEESSVPKEEESPEVADSEAAEPVAAESAATEEASSDEPSSGPSAEEDDDLAAAEAAMDDEEPAVAPAGPIELIEDEEEDIQKDWYILKVQSNRERSISAALQRKVAIEGLDRYFGQILVPTEKVTEFKAGKKKIVERKIWPGYIAVEMHVNDDTWFAIRETSGIGDFTGSAGKPTPMAQQDINKILHTEEEEADESPKLAIPFNEGDKVKVKEGNFESFEGEVSKIDDIHGKVTVMLSIFGRPTPVELEYWQVENL